MKITDPIVVAFITAIAGIMVTALSFLLTKMKEREADWRAQKLEHYKAFMLALNAIVGPPATVEERVSFANAANNIFLVGSRDVLVALRGFLDWTADSRPSGLPDRHDELLTKLIIAIRRDIGTQEKELPAGYEFRLWSGKPRV